MITTTLNRIREHKPCQDGWTNLLKGLGKTAPDDEPLPYVEIVRINGLSDALWCCRAEPQHACEWRLYAVWCARQVQHLMTDPRSVAALDVAERYAVGAATDKELHAAWHAAWAAAGDAEWATVRYAAYAAAAVDAAWAAWIAARAAWAASGDAEWASVREAALGAAAGDAEWAAWIAARAAWDTARAAQTARFLEVVS